MLSSLPHIYPTDMTGLQACSAALGCDSLLVQGGGGNTSLKIGSTLWIKASGKWLSQANNEDIFVPVDLKTFAANNYSASEPVIALSPEARTSLRPSIETSLHAVLPHKVVFHVHPLSVLALAVRADAEDCFKDRTCHFISYTKPGWDLARAVSDAWKKRPDINVFILANHGLVVAGDTVDETYHLLTQTVAACDAVARDRVNPDTRKTDNWLAGHTNMRSAVHPVTHMLALDPISYGCCEQGVLYPDQAVFLGASLVETTDLRYAIIRNVGVFVATDAPIGTEEMLACHAEMLRRIPEGTALNVLNRQQIDSLLNWDAEHYRQGKVG